MTYKFAALTDDGSSQTLSPPKIYRLLSVHGAKVGKKSCMYLANTAIAFFLNSLSIVLKPQLTVKLPVGAVILLAMFFTCCR